MVLGVSHKGSDLVREVMEGVPKKAMLEPWSEGLAVSKAEKGYSRQRKKQHVQRPCDKHGPCSWNKESERAGSTRDIGRTRPCRTLWAMLRVWSLLQGH